MHSYLLIDISHFFLYAFFSVRVELIDNDVLNLGDAWHFYLDFVLCHFETVCSCEF